MDFNLAPSYDVYVTLSPKEQQRALLQILPHPTRLQYFMESMIAYKNAVTKQYKYLITFTTRADTREGAEVFLRSQAQREALQLTRFAYTIEHAQENMHFHVFLVSKRPIQKSDFKHWTNTRGYVDFKPVKDGTDGNVISYISKENPPQELVF